MSLVTQPHNYLPPLYQSHLHPVNSLYLLYLPQLSCICPRLLPRLLSLSVVKTSTSSLSEARSPNMLPHILKKQKKRKKRIYRNVNDDTDLHFPSDGSDGHSASNRVKGWRCEGFKGRSLWDSVKQRFGFKVVVDGKSFMAPDGMTAWTKQEVYLEFILLLFFPPLMRLSEESRFDV